MTALGPLVTKLALIACFAASVAMSLGASAEVINLNGVRITSEPSLSGSCGRDLVVAVTDGNQHFVMIDYTYHGIFNPLGLVMPVRTRETRSGVLNVSVGKFTYAGELTRLSTDTMGLDCAYGSDFMFRAAQENVSQQQRDYQEKLRQKEQARLDEIKKREEEALANKRRAEQQQRDFKASQERMKMDRLEAYRRASPENARCIINEPADIAKCEQWKAREKAEQLQRDQAAIRSSEIEAANARQKEAGAAGVAKAAREMESNNCTYAAAPPARIPYPAFNNNEAQYRAEVKRIDALNWEAEQNFLSEVRAAGDACDARRRGAGDWQQRQQQQQQEALRIQAEQQRQNAARQRALADLEVQVQRGQQTVNDAAANTRGMQNDNANLQDMINRMK